MKVGRLRELIIAATVVIAVTSGANAQQPLSYRTVLPFFMQASAGFDYELAADDYLKCFNSAVWDRIQNNEFELKKVEQQTASAMKGTAAGSQTRRMAVLRTASQFGDYDSTSGSFAFRPFNETTHISLAAPCSGAVFLPTRIDVYFTNPDFINGIRMAGDQARSFLTRRRGNRAVDLTVTLQLTLVRSETEIEGTIVKAEVFDSGVSSGSLLQTFVK